jgi:hypothetical protein
MKLIDPLLTICVLFFEVFVRTPHTITCVTSHRNVQCILRLHDTPESVIQAFDVDCCGVYYNGRTVVATDRAVRAVRFPEFCNFGVCLVG